MYILTDNNFVLRAISNEFSIDELDETIIYMDGAGYGLYGQQIHEVESVPDYVRVDKYKFVDNEFIINEDYKDESMSIEALMEENTTLKLAVAELAERQEIARIENQLALAELAETLLLGGDK